MHKYQIGDKLLYCGVHEVKVIGFDVGFMPSIPYRVQKSNGYTFWTSEDALSDLPTQKGVDSSMKHDGYVVVNLTDGVVSFGLTKEQAESEVDYYLKDDIDAENILVYAPNTNLPFRHGVELMEEE